MTKKLTCIVLNTSWSFQLQHAYFYLLRGIYSVPFLSRPRFKGWPHHGHTFSIYLYPLWFYWLFHRESCPRLDVVYPGRVWSSSPAYIWHCSLHYFFSPDSSLASSWYDHSMLASLLWHYLTVPSLLSLCWEPTHLFSLLSTKHAESFSVLSLVGPQGVFLHFFWVSRFHSRTWLQATLALSLVLSSLKSVCCDFFIFLHWWALPGVSYVCWWLNTDVVFVNSLTKMTDVFVHEASEELDLTFNAKKSSIIRVGKDIKTRNVGQCPTWWPPCRI